MSSPSTLLDTLGPSNATQASISIPNEHSLVFMAWRGVSRLLGALVWRAWVCEKCVQSTNQCSHSTLAHLRPQ
jgi:hypothetical protein